MKTNRKESSARNFFWGMVSRGVSLVCPFIIRTLIIQILGAEYLGLGSLYTSILQVLSLSELGISSAITYSLYAPVADDDNIKVTALLSFIKKIYIKIGCIMLGAGILLMPFLPYLIKEKVVGDINIYILYFLYLLNASVSYFLFSYKSVILNVVQRYDIESKILVIINICMYLVQIIVLLLTKNYYLYYIAYPISTIAMNLVRSRVVDRLYPQYCGAALLSKEEEKSIWSKVKALLIYKIGGIVSNSADNIVISAFLGLTVVTMYNNYYYIVAALFSIFAIYYESIKASVGNSVVTESKEKNEETFLTLLMMQGWIVAWCSVCLLCLFQPFMKIWMGRELMFDSLTVVLLAIYFFVWKMQDIVYVFKEVLGFWEKDRMRPLVASIVNLGLNLATVQFWGIYGVIGSTIVAELAVSLPWAPNILYRDYFNKSPKQFYYKVLKYALIALFAGGVTYKICGMVKVDNNWVYFLYCIVLCIIVPNIIFFLFFRNDKEFEKAKNWTKSILFKAVQTRSN